MRCVVALGHRFDRTPDGAVWTQTMFAYPFWTRYLAVFDEVRVVGRVREVAQAAPGWLRSDGPDVSFTPIPYYVGPWQYARRAGRIREAGRGAASPEDAVVLRVPSMVATAVEPWLRRAGHPYAVEVTTDPHEVFAPGATRHPLRPFFRWQFARDLRRACARACTAAYVTEKALQRRYPPGPAAPATHFSDVELPEAAFAASPRVPRQDPGPRTLITVGSLATLCKAPDVLIDAVARCVSAGLEIRLVLVGDGRHRPELEQRAAAAGLAKWVHFRGQVPAGEAVRRELDASDLFVLPSRTEGLPRALVEAMARALPCIGSAVGGIPELLPPEDMVPPGDAAALAGKIGEVIADSERTARMSAHNLARARAYREDALRDRREAFYRFLEEHTASWLSTAGGGSAPLPRGPVEKPSGQGG